MTQKKGSSCPARDCRHLDVTSSFSQNSNSTSKVIILKLQTTSKRSWQTSWGHFHMKTSSTATRSGSNISGGVWLPKGTTLKGIILICISVVNKNFIATVSLLLRHTSWLVFLNLECVKRQLVINTFQITFNVCSLNIKNIILKVFNT